MLVEFCTENSPSWRVQKRRNKAMNFMSWKFRVENAHNKFTMLWVSAPSLTSYEMAWMVAMSRRASVAKAHAKLDKPCMLCSLIFLEASRQMPSIKGGLETCSLATAQAVLARHCGWNSLSLPRLAQPIACSSRACARLYTRSQWPEHDVSATGSTGFKSGTKA